MMENKIDKIKEGAAILSKGVEIISYAFFAEMFIFVLLALSMAFFKLDIEKTSSIEAMVVVVISIIISLTLSILFRKNVEWRGYYGSAMFDAMFFIVLTIVIVAVIAWLLNFFGIFIGSLLVAIAFIAVSMVLALLIILGFEWQDRY